MLRFLSTVACGLIAWQCTDYATGVGGFWWLLAAYWGVVTCAVALRGAP